MSPVRYLSLLTARHSSSFTETPVRGKSSPVADSLSHFQFQLFRRLAPHADSISTQIPRKLLSDKCPFYLNQGLEKFMPLPNAASWISVLRKIAQLFWDQLFHPVKTCSCCHLADTLHCSSITFQQSDPFTSRRVCLLPWLVAFGYSVCCGVSNVT